MGRQLSVLDLAVAHQEALVSALAGAADAAEVERVARAAGDFYLEGLSAFEMVQRGFAEARQTAMQGRRRTELSRQLSTFLADASLARDPHDALEEMLQLVAEQARELLDAECCVVTVADGARAASSRGARHPLEGVRPLAGPARDLRAAALRRRYGPSVRREPRRAAALPVLGRGDAAARVARGLAHRARRHGLGAVQVFDKATGPFTGEDAAALIHLAQIASAAVERVQLYRG